MRDEPVFIDTNIFMYATGKDHPYKKPCARIVLGMASGSFHEETGTPVTDSEVFQEILYRFALIRRWQDGISVCHDLLALGLDILPVRAAEVEKMIDLAQKYQTKGIPPRDLVHAAVMMNHGIKNVISVDSHFDAIGEVARIDPRGLADSL